MCGHARSGAFPYPAPPPEASRQCRAGNSPRPSSRFLTRAPRFPAILALSLTAERSLSANAFFQQGPSLGNQFRSDPLLRSYLAWRIPAEILDPIAPGLSRLGERAVGDIAALGADAEANPPELVHFDPWGRRVDEIRTAAGWERLHDVAAEEGIVAVAYERREGEWSRLHQFARLYLFSPSSAIYACPLAMTDGAARVLELIGNPALRERAFTRLTSRDPAKFWTSGQWMTERAGGSDVSGTGTEAVADGDAFRLYGSKWFSSATTSEMALTLAKLSDRPGLSLFYLETRDEAGALNGIRVDRLKDKLGTRALPTAELTLDGTRAQLLGEPGAGVRSIATMLNVTRLYNAVCSVSAMRRGIALARDYAGRRSVFGRRLIDQPLHAETLAALEVELHGSLHLVFHLGWLLGREETGQAGDAERALLRLLTPVAKLYTGKQAVAVCSEVLECFGGAGYVEDTGLPALLRNAQVLPIWEGTTNGLSLDVQRVLHKGDALAVLAADVESRLRAVSATALADPVRQAGAGLQALLEQARGFAGADADGVEAAARGFAWNLARVYAGALLLEHAQWALAGNTNSTGNGDRAAEAARRWCSQPLRSGAAADSGHREASMMLARGEP